MKSWRRVVGAASLCSALLQPWNAAEGAIVFVDATLSAGISHVGATFGASWGDFNGDGWPDLWVGNHFTPAGPSLYVNNGDGTFRDVANAVWPGPVQDSHGTAWGDVNRDGSLDLYEMNGGDEPNRLWMNESGRFADRAAQWGAQVATSRARTPLWFDWNRDGNLDLLLSEEQGAKINPFALRNTGSGFVDATYEIGVSFASTQSLYLADITGDGTLDVASLSGASASFPGVIYDTSTTPFVLRSELSNAGDGVSDAAFADFNGDLKTDYFAARGVGPKQLVVRSSTRVEFRMVVSKNENAVAFVGAAPVRLEIYPDTALQASTYVGAGHINYSGTPTPDVGYNSYALILDPSDPNVVGTPAHVAGVDQGIFISYDPSKATWTVASSAPRTQDVRFVITSTAAIQNPTTIGFAATQNDPWPYYYVRTATGFVESRSVSGLASGMPCFSAVAGDFDNDTDIDIYLACTRGVENVSNILLENRGDGTFVKVPLAGGAAGSLAGRSESVVVADYDRNGFLDLFVTNGEGGEPFNNGPHQLFRNVGNTNSWLEMDLKGRFSNSTGIGAVVKVTAGGKTQLREQNGGIHNHAQNFERIHVGLGTNRVIDSIEIQWPSGIKQVLLNVPANQVLTIVETGITACSDGIDNDGDGAIDYPADANCASWSGNSETDPAGIYLQSTPEWVYLQGSGSNGWAVVEAENYYATTQQTPYAWTTTTAPTGFRGTGAMVAAPNMGKLIDTDYATTSPRLDYKVKFVKTGTHYVWIRGTGLAGDGSVHMGLDGAPVASSARMSDVSSSWKWSNLTSSGVIATFNVATPGVHTVNVWMREDGFTLDTLAVTSNAAAVGGSGLTESYRYNNHAPTLTTWAGQQSLESETITLQVQAIDDDKDVLRYSAQGLPPGLAIDSATGVISGTIAAGAALTSPSTVTICVDDGSGTSNATASMSFSWQVSSVPSVASNFTYQQGAGSYGWVVVEAEHYNVRADQSGHGWTLALPSGFRGEGAMAASPNTGMLIDTNVPTLSPRVDYQINFVKTGTHYVWLRGLGALVDGSVHVGLDGVLPSSSDRIGGNFSSAWRWSRDTLDGVVATINVTALGVHTLNLWMRDDGFTVDTIALTVDPAAVPGSGLAESYRY